MALYPCGGRGGTETSLWRNSNQDIDQNFSGRDITLSQTYMNFDYVKIVYTSEIYRSAAQISLRDKTEIIFPVERITFSSSSYRCHLTDYIDGNYYREFYKKSSTVFTFSNDVYEIDDETDGDKRYAEFPYNCVPLEIIGLKV